MTVTANHVQTFFANYPGGAELIGPSAGTNSLQIFWPGGRGLIVPNGSLTGGSSMSFIFLLEDGSDNTPFKQFVAASPLFSFDFWRPRGFIYMSVSSPGEGDTANVNAKLVSLETA